MSALQPDFQLRILVLRAQSGDLKALDELLLSLQAALYRYILGIAGERALAEDLLQDVFLAICRNLRHLREPQFVRAWAYRIASRRALRGAARERKRRGLPLEDAAVDPAALVVPAAEDGPYEAELIAAIPAALAEVSPASRAVLSLHYLEELSLQETADVLEIPLGTAKSRLGYGLASIRRIMRRKQEALRRTKGGSNDRCELERNPASGAGSSR